MLAGHADQGRGKHCGHSRCPDGVSVLPKSCLVPTSVNMEGLPSRAVETLWAVHGGWITQGQ